MLKKADNYITKFNFLTFVLCLYVILMPLIPDDLMIKGKLVKGDYILFIVFLCYFIRIIVYKESRCNLLRGIKSFFKDSIIVFMILLFLSMIISVNYATDKNLAMNESIRFLTYIIIYFIIKYEIKTEKAFKNILNSYIVSCFIVSGFGILQYFTKMGLNEKFIYDKKSYSVALRITSTLGNSNSLAAFSVLAIFPLIMISMYEKSKIKKVLYSIVSILVCITIVIAFSRNSWIAFFIGIILLIIMYNWKIIFALFATGGIGILIPSVRSRLQDFKVIFHNPRIKMWKIALKMIKDHPILGVGNGNYYTLFGEYVKKYPELDYNKHLNFPSHNSYLKVQSELGILGIVFFILLIVSVIIKLKNVINFLEDGFCKAFYKGFYISAIVFLFMNISDNLFFVPKISMYFWIIVAISQSIIYNNICAEK